jgi:SpoIID/LytB domain protein
VEQTAGRVLWYSGEICDDVFCGVCGGHSENADKAWGKGTVDYLKGNYDGSGLRHYGRLSNEKDARKWIDSSPASCCNTIQKSYPRAFEYTQKYFRWQTRIDRYELEAGLLQNDYPRIGTIRDLIPEERGISGRIIRLRVIGSEGAIDLQGELKIRKALSPQTLWSSCFYIEKTLSPDGILSGFVLKGAGWGHGVGMCQTGAAGMALAGKRCDQILRQYFHGARIKNLY